MSFRPTKKLLVATLAVGLATSSLTVASNPVFAQDDFEDDTPLIPVAGRGPVVNIKDATFTAGARHEHTFTITDPDGDRLRQALWTPYDGFELAHVEGDTWKIVVTPAAKPGKYEIDVQGEDVNGNQGDVATATITVVANTPAPQPTNPAPNPGTNRGPVVNIADTTIDNRRANEIPFTVTDPEGDRMHQLWWYPEPGFELTSTDQGWKLVAPRGIKTGTYNIRLWATDVRGAKGDERVVKITVVDGTPAPNPQPTTPPQPNPQPTPPPAGTQGPVISLRGGTFDNRQQHVIPFTVTDPQGDRINQVWWYPIDGFDMRWTQNGWEIVINQGVRPGTYRLRLHATDVRGNAGPETDVTVVITGAGNNNPNPGNPSDPNPGTNDGPRVQVSNGTYDNRRTNSHTFRFVDPEGDHVPRVWWYPIDGMALRHVRDNEWAIDINPGVRPGNYNLRIWAADEHGKQGPEGNATLTITGNPVNAAPTIQSGRITMYAGYPYTYNVPVSDPDNDPLTLRIVGGGASWMRVNGTRLELTPNTNVSPGTYPVTIEVSDGRLTDRGTYEVTVRRW